MIYELLDNNTNVWERLKETDKPIVLYGTGNGADKILDVFEEKNIKASGVFASDGFVRNRTFRDMKVMSLDETKKTFGDFIVVISFASSLEPVIENMQRINNEYETYAPDVPVYGDTLCDSKWFENNTEKIKSVYDWLFDEESKNIYKSVLNYRYSGKIDYLLNNESKRSEVIENLLDYKNINSYCDLGAYKGDTIDELLEYNPHAKIIGIEPDKKTFEKCYAKYEGNDDIQIINAAAWNNEEIIEFSGGGSRGNSHNKEGKRIQVPTIRLDSVSPKNTEYIKYDVEGSEFEALEGSQQTILNCKPKLLVSLYHRSNDIFELPIYLKNKYPYYSLYLRRERYIPAWDLNLICLNNS